MVNAAAARRRQPDRPARVLRSVKLPSQLFAGVTDATMTHGEAWHFCRLGRKLERADKTSRILDVKYFLLLPDGGGRRHAVRRHPVGGRAAIGERVRDVPQAARPHRRPTRIVEFLLLDREFPRAMRYCLMAARESVARDLRHAAGHVPQPRRAAARRALLRAGLRAGRRDHRRRAARVSRSACRPA